MGTRSIIHIKEGRKTIATIYRQYDGYPSGMGNDIKNILNKGMVNVKNGFSGNDVAPSSFNGVGCLAAYLIGELKEKQIGNVYIMAPNTKDVGEEYIYTLSLKDNFLHMQVKDVWNKKVIFKDVLTKFDGAAVEKAA